MSPRRIGILLAVAVVVIAVAFWLSSRGHHDLSEAVGKPVLPDLKKSLNEVSELRFAKADGAHATLRKEGDGWVVAEREFAADASRVRKLLLDLSSLEVVEEKTSNPERYSALSVEDVGPADASKPAPAKANAYDFGGAVAATRIDVVTPGKTWSLINGKSGGGKAGYVRVVGSKQSLLASPRLDTDSEPQRWLEKTIVDIPQARIQSVAVQTPKGAAYTVSRDKKETENFSVSNLPKGRKLSYEGAGNSLASSLESVSLDDIRAKATYKTFDGLTVELTGRKESAPGLKKDDPKVEHHFISLAASSTDKATQPEAEKLNAHVAGKEFEVSSYKFEGMFKPLEDLLEPLPEKKKPGGKTDAK